MAASPYVPDPRDSRAVVIGVSRYWHMADLPAVANNVASVAEVLTDPRVWGLPSRNCHVVHNPDSISAVLDPVHEAAESARAALLVYFAGHGVLDETSELYLALPEGSVDRLHRAVRFAEIRRETVQTARNCGAKVVILDCCFSGRAMSGFMSSSSAIADQAVVDGAYLMTATSETTLAAAPQGARYTEFTGSIINVLRHGVPGGPAWLDMDMLFTAVQDDLRSRHRPLPHRRSRDAGHRIAIARNAAAGGAAADKPRPSAQPRRHAEFHADRFDRRRAYVARHMQPDSDDVAPLAPDTTASTKETPGQQMTLHAAMREVLQDAPGQRMRAADIASEITRRALYRMQDGRPVEPQQIHARVGNYPKIFTREGTFIKLL